MITGKTLFQCPNCAKALKQGERQYFCQSGHSFDIAKKGYVNLLLPGHTGAGNPGDSREMLQSRKEFLNEGYYERFSAELSDIAANSFATGASTGDSTSEGDSAISLLDAGCGEGYYISRLKKRLDEKFIGRETDIYGIDVSRPAINLAAGRSREIRFAVASSYHIPILSRSLDLILCIFAPRDESEFSRILKPSGRLIVAAPGPRHLYSFRKLLYGGAEEIGQKGTVGEGFKLLEQHSVKHDIKLKSNRDIYNLFMMTPYSRHADVSALANLGEYVTEVDFSIFVHQRIF